jgi:hypothetical protein
MSQELQSAKFLRQPSSEEMAAYRRRAMGSSNWWPATKSMFFLLFWIAILGGGGYLVYNAVHKTQQEKRWSGTGAGPAMSVLSFCMHLVHLDWDKRVEDYQDHLERTTWPKEPDPPFRDGFADWPDHPEMADRVREEDRLARWKAEDREREARRSIPETAPGQTYVAVKHFGKDAGLLFPPLDSDDNSLLSIPTILIISFWVVAAVVAAYLVRGRRNS